MIDPIASAETQILGIAENEQNNNRAKFTHLNRCYEGSQRIRFMGMAVPPELRKFELVINWPAVVVDTIAARQDVKSLYLPGEDTASQSLQEAWDYNDLDAEMDLMNRDRLIYGRSFMSIGANEEDPEHPLIQVESPYEISVEIDGRHRRVSRAVRLYKSESNAEHVNLATIYTPNTTSWFERINGKWMCVDRDHHKLGQVPLVPIVHGKRTTRPLGASVMEDIIPITEAAARALTNLQVAAEALAVPKRYIFGTSPKDFQTPDGDTQSEWEAYYTSIIALTNKDAKIGQLPAADLGNFHETVRFYGELAASVTGFPIRYFGRNTANPPSADSIRAEEAQLVKRVERDNTQVGNAIGRVLGIYEQIRTGKRVNGNCIRVEWHDPATPTVAQRADALQKLAGGTPILSREGAWDELGWSEPRKAKERIYFTQQYPDLTGVKGEEME